MNVKVIKIRVMVEDRGQRHEDLSSEICENLSCTVGFHSMERFEVTGTVEVDSPKTERDLTDNQRVFVEDAEAEGLEVDYDYSGRGMYGRTCPAVRLKQYESFETSADCSQDSMGMGTVMYVSG